MLHLGLELYYECFWDLTSDRQMGYGIGPIPTSMIINYGRALGLDETQMDSLLYYIRALDNVYLDFRAKEIKQGWQPQ